MSFNRNVEMPLIKLCSYPDCSSLPSHTLNITAWSSAIQWYECNVHTRQLPDCIPICVRKKKPTTQYVIKGDALAGNDQLLALIFIRVVVQRQLTPGNCFRGLPSAAISYRTNKSMIRSRDVHGTKKNFLVPVKDLCAVPLIQLINYCLTAHFVEKWLLFKPIYFQIYQKFSLSKNLGNRATGTKSAGPTGTTLVPVAVFTELFDNENLWYV